MYWKETRWRRAQQLKNASTDRFEMPECGVITGVKLDFRMSNSAQIELTARQRIAERMTRIAVVTDKQETLFAMSGDQLRALNFYQEGHTLSETATLLNSKSQLTTLFIPFGRFKCDREYMLDMGKYCNLTLEITNDLTATQCADGACNVDIQLVEAQELSVVPKNYIKHWQNTRQKPRGANQDILIELPSADPIQKVIVQMIPDLDEANKPVADPITDANRLLLLLGGQKQVKWDMRPKDIARENAIIYGRPRADGKYAVTDAIYADSTIGYVENFVDANIFDGAQMLPPLNEDSNDRFFKMTGVLGPFAIDIKHSAVGIAYWHTFVLWDSLRVNGDDLLMLKCGCNHLSPATIQWMPTTADHYFATIIGATIAQGKS